MRTERKSSPVGRILLFIALVLVLVALMTFEADYTFATRGIFFVTGS